MTKPKDQIFDHEYDGIREFDNPVPAWWNWIFWGSIVFSLVYFLHYHVLGTGIGVFAAYEADMEVHKKLAEERALAVLKNLTEDKLVAIMDDPAQVEAGRAKYGAVCVACHAEQGQGLVGPNLTDDYWIHADGSLMSIRKIVATGVAEKGMPAWEKLMSAEELHQVVAFVGTLRGTNVEGKAPEGKKVETDLTNSEM